MGEKSEVGEGKWNGLTHDQRAEYLGRYRLLLETKRRSPRYVVETTALIHRVLHATKWDIDEDAVLMALAGMRDKGMSICTSNRYVVCLRSFARWLTRRGLFPLNPLQFLPLLNAKLDRRHERGALTDVEIHRLLTTTEASKFAYMGIVGRERAALYHGALATGLREGTLAILTAEQFQFDPPGPVVVVRAEQMKDGDDLTLPLHPACAERLRKFLNGKPPDSLAFRTPPHSWNFAPMLRKDLLAAKIPYCREEVLPNGRIRRREVRDFHALRATAATRWIRNGLPIGLAQQMLGHSTAELTQRYNHPTTPDLRAAVERLPPMPG